MKTMLTIMMRLYWAFNLVMVMMAMMTSSVSVSNRGLDVHNILPSFRTEVKHCYQCAYTPPKYSASNSDNEASNLQGGWDKCLGPFTQYEAAEYGVDVWKCRSYCYTRRDPNGDIFRGCYKGEYGVDPSLFGCHRQADAVYCFCDGDRCNSEQAPPEDYR